MIYIKPEGTIILLLINSRSGLIDIVENEKFSATLSPS